MGMRQASLKEDITRSLRLWWCGVSGSVHSRSGQATFGHNQRGRPIDPFKMDGWTILPPAQKSLVSAAYVTAEPILVPALTRRWPAKPA